MASAWGSGWFISAIISPTWLEMNCTATAPTSSDLAIALPSSASAWVENSRASPLIGLSRENCGASDLADSTQPPSSMGDTRAISSSRMNSGSRANRLCCAKPVKWATITAGSNATLRSNRNDCSMTRPSWA
ncbi:hypothetical protein D3C80_1771580 [compost metagenome]